MTAADRFDACIYCASKIVAFYRAQAPAGFDPQNGPPSVAAPAQRDLGSEILQTYYGQARTAQPSFNLESYFQPRYGQVQLGNLQQQLFGYNVPGPGGQTGQSIAGTPGAVNAGATGAPAGGTLRIPRPGAAVNFQDPYAGGGPSQAPGYHPGTLALGAAANTFQRGSDIADVARYGPAATQAFLAANPFLAGGLQNLYGRTADSPILQQLNQQAQSALASGGQLSPQDVRASDQAARAAYSARGLVGSNPAAAAEILNRDSAVRQRLAAAQQLASGVQGLNQQQADLVGRASQIFSTTLSDPFTAILGRPSGAAGGIGGSGYPQQIGTGARLFDPMNPYAQDIYNTNYNAQAAANIANANAQSAQQSGLLSAGGSILGGLATGLALSDEALKKNVRKTGEKTKEGVPIKTWIYKTDPKKRKYRGVVAQDVEKVVPRAVLTDPVSGLKLVDYSKINSPFELLTRKAA